MIGWEKPLLVIPSRPCVAGAVRGAPWQPWTRRAASPAASIPVLHVITPQPHVRGRGLSLSRTRLPCSPPARTASAFADRIPQMPAGRRG